MQIQVRLVAFVYLRSCIVSSVDYKIAINNWDLEYSDFGLALCYLFTIEQKRKIRTDSPPVQLLLQSSGRNWQWDEADLFN